jgi:hypothetical protein
MGKAMLDYRRFKEINDLFASGQGEKARHLLMEMQSRCIALRDEMSMLRIRLQSIEDALYLSENLYEDGGYYWLKTSGVRQGPFCPRCYQAEGGLIRLEKHKQGLECPYCYSIYRNLPKMAPPAPEKQARILQFARQM